MDTHQITKAYADWCTRQGAGLYFVLNHANSKTSKPLNYEALSGQVRKLFYQLECEEWGYDQRESRWGRRYSRIERVVCIEKATYYHANVMMMTPYGDKTNEEQLKRAVVFRMSLLTPLMILNRSRFRRWKQQWKFLPARLSRRTT